MCRIVPYQPHHNDAMIAVVRAVYDEYGFTWEADGYHRDLYDIEAAYLQRGGMFWVVLSGSVKRMSSLGAPPLPGVGDRSRDCSIISGTSLAEDRVIGCAGVTQHDGGECELHRMYLLPSYRGRGLGRRLLETVTAYARTRGCRRILAWSDVKLTLAHRLYLKHGFVQEGERICDDPDQALEYGFWKEPL